MGLPQAEVLMEEVVAVGGLPSIIAPQTLLEQQRLMVDLAHLNMVRTEPLGSSTCYIMIYTRVTPGDSKKTIAPSI